MKGILIGIIFGVPVGTIGALTIRRSIAYGVVAGIVSGMGCCVADLLYACISIFGVTLISDILLAYQKHISIVGGLFVIGMGIQIIRKGHHHTRDQIETKALFSFFLSSFLIAVTNPATILTFMIAFSVFEIENMQHTLEGISLAGGIFIGTSMWWLLMALIINGFKERLTDKRLKVINTVLGILVIVFGLFIIGKEGL